MAKTEKAWSEENNKGVVKWQEVSMYQPSQQKLGAIFQNNGRKTLDAIQTSLELPCPSQAQSRRTWGENGFKGGVTSTCRTLVHAAWHHIRSWAPLLTLGAWSFVSPERASGGLDAAQSTMSTPQEGSVQFSSVAQLCPTLCDPMNYSMPGLPVHHQLPEFTQTHVHRVSDAIQPFHPLSPPSPPALNISQHQSLFQWVNSSHELAKVLEFQL